MSSNIEYIFIKVLRIEAKHEWKTDRQTDRVEENKRIKVAMSRE